MTIHVSGPDNGVALISIDRPEKRNALTRDMRDAIVNHLHRLSSDRETRVVVLTGAGRTFCAGFDLSEMKEAPTSVDEDPMAASDRFHHAILDFPLPTVAAVNGPAIAAGFDVAVLADLRVASESARFAHPEHAWGEVIYRPLRDLIGGSAARDLVLTGRSIDAQEGLAMGLVTQVVPDSEIIASSLRLGATIAEAPRHVLERMKAKIVSARGISKDATTLDL